MFKKKKLFSLMLSFVMIVSMGLTAFASTSIPSTTIDLSTSGMVLGFQVDSVRYGNLFTDYCFKGVETATVSIGQITVNKNGSADTSEPLTVHLHKKGTSAVDVQWDCPLSGGMINFINLDKSAKYYLEFSKRNDGQIYSFSGTVFKG